MADEISNTPPANPPTTVKRRTIVEQLEAARETRANRKTGVKNADSEVRRLERRLEKHQHRESLEAVEGYNKSLPGSPFTVPVLLRIGEKATKAGRSVQSVMDFLDGKRPSSGKKGTTDEAQKTDGDSQNLARTDGDGKGGRRAELTSASDGIQWHLQAAASAQPKRLAGVVGQASLIRCRRQPNGLCQLRRRRAKIWLPKLPAELYHCQQHDSRSSLCHQGDLSGSRGAPQGRREDGSPGWIDVPSSKGQAKLFLVCPRTDSPGRTSAARTLLRSRHRQGRKANRKSQRGKGAG